VGDLESNFSNNSQFYFSYLAYSSLASMHFFESYREPHMRAAESNAIMLWRRLIAFSSLALSVGGDA
jgi:hypothetical protein